MQATEFDLPGSIDIRSKRSIYLAKQLQFEDEPLTRTVERCLEKEFAAREQRAAELGLSKLRQPA